MKILNITKYTLLGCALSVAPITLYKTNSNIDIKIEQLNEDRFEQKIPPKGTNDSLILKNAPDPTVTIKGKQKFAKIVVDTEHNVLYTYKNGIPEFAYLVATGKPSTPSKKGIYAFSHSENYPYLSAPKTTKRSKNPKAFGPKILLPKRVNPKTGEKTECGQFIHGNNNPSSIGTHASGGCIRMDNSVIIKLARRVKHNDIILVK